MAPSPPGSPAGGGVQRPMSAMVRSSRSASRMSMSSRQCGGSRAADDDGKTAVKVAVRVRPPLQPSDPGYDLVPQRFRRSTCHVTSPTSLAVESAQGKKLFVFDRVFSENVDQEGVWEYLSESVSSFVLGYNVSILAYGQSGAGKSYTMGTTGPKEQSDPSLMGVVPRAAIALFEKLCGSSSSRTSASGLRSPSRYSSHGLPTLQSFSKTAERNWQMKATYVEIYNEQLRDLLVPESVPQSERAPVTIREDTKGRIILTGLQQVTINSADDLLSALNFGSSIRQTDATAVNAKSSRSHAVFSLNLVQKKSKPVPSSAQEKRFSVPIEAMSGSESWVTVDSKLHFVDLAGSERLKNTGAQGERAKEGISINAGLASLGKVISQLSSRSAGSHVSYRDSRLTRLLQDSLGGNAITYMVACVTPAEFHLSETLNTVQYAQRARAIQSKPEIQQVSDDGDKQAVIDRLRAEVSFLRDQIRLSERADRRNIPPQDKVERQHEREIELQNQLLDVQENYSALSQRHAKLISELAKARGPEFEDTSSKNPIGDSAVERLKRSNSFAEAVEQVVLEYEKTIQSLEASLSSTRSSLASSESILLEKETKVAYMENVTQQLQARIQKAMDREADDETYLHDLEAKVAGVTSGEEKSHAVIQSLRKELSKARGNEAACEQYISTLEERLTEADQDHEIMQREIERLEHVVERQRSIGKLDNLLYELDHMRQTEPGVENGSTTNGHLKRTSDSFHSFAPSEITNEDEDLDGAGRTEEQSSETIVETEVEAPPVVSGSDGANPDVQDTEDFRRTPVAKSLAPVAVDTPQSSAQSQAVADKLETVTQELFDLRMEHESTVNDHDELNRKYQLALNTLAELQDAVDEARSVALREEPSPASTRPSSFLAHARVNGHEEDGQHSSSRTLLSELSLLGEPSNTMGASDAETAYKRLGSLEAAHISQKEEQLIQEMKLLKKLNAEKEENVAELTENYALLQEKHQDTLDYVEKLKVEVQRAHLARPASPSAQVLRRKSSQNVMASERANRSLVSLRNIAAENFECQPDVIQSFEINLNAVITELQARTERVTALEAELASVRKEMESKMTIISGLTRERSSLKVSSPMDISIMSTMRDQLLESENQIRALREAHAVREQDLLEQMESFKAILEVHDVPSGNSRKEREDRAFSSHMPGVFPETPAPEPGTIRELGTEAVASADSQAQITQLEKQVEEWKDKHFASLELVKASEQQLQATINDLETSLRQAEVLQAEPTDGIKQKFTGANTAHKSDNETSHHQEVVAALQKEVDEHKTTAATNAVRLAELEQSYASILCQIEDDTRSKELTEKELKTHRHLVANLESQIEEHKSVISTHQQNMKALQESHSKEIEELEAAALAAQTKLNERVVTQTANHGDAALTLQDELAKTRSQHEGAIASLQEELGKAQAQTVNLVKGVASALNKETDASQLHSHVQALVDERQSLLTQREQAAGDLRAVRDELDAAKASISELQSKMEELKTVNEEIVVELRAISEKEKKSSRLVEELEDQLNSNYDQHQAANNRLSALQVERQVQLEEALQTKSEIERELDEARARVKQLESRLHDGKRNSHRDSLDPRDATLQRSNSDNSNARKSTSHNSLPSPPPAIPLPPLPGSPPAAASAPSPPTSRHQSKDIAQAQLFEDQEARIRTIEKHLFAEKQLTATLEEALTDLEASSTRLKSDMDGWRKKCIVLEDELSVMKKERNISRYSLQQVEEERNARMRVEADRANLEVRMAQLNAAIKKKKKSTLNCF